MAFVPKRSELERFFGPNAIPEWVDAFARLSPGLCEFYGFNRLRWVHFMGQIAAETNGLSLRRMEENMNFKTAKRILEVYSYRLGLALKTPEYRHFKTKAALAQYLVGKPVELAKVVYSNREGTPPGQGHLYIGRGPLQTTHLNNYRAAGDEVARQPGGEKFDLVASPELLSTDCELGVRVAFAEWHLKKLNIWADRDDCDTVSDVLNTGNPYDNVKPHGLNERRRWTAKAKVIWPDDGMPAPEMPASALPVASEGVLKRGSRGGKVLVLQKRLRELGYHPGAEDGIYGLLTERAVKLFQSEHGLEVDGIAGPKTLEAMKNSAPADLGERETVTAKELKKRGSRIVILGQRIREFCRWLYTVMFGTALAESTGLGVIDNATSMASRINSFIDQLGLPAGVTSPKVWVILSITGIGLMAFLIGKWGKGIVEARVEDAQSGAHLGR